MGLDCLLDLANSSADDLTDLLALLEEYEGRHGAHTLLSRHVLTGRLWGGKLRLDCS